MSGNFEGIKTQRFGVEIECTGLTRAAAAKAVAKILGGSPDHFGGSYDRYDVYDSQGRRWKIMSDASIRCTTKNGEPASKLHSVELVTPILEYGDMALLQEVVRSIRRSGGICNESTGIHIHIDFEPYDPQKLRNLVNIFASKEDMLYQALQVDSNRESTYCKKVDKHFVEELNRKKPKDLQTIKQLWYGDNAEYHSHYDSSRYRCLNLHPVFTDNNIEVRAFNSSLNAGVLRAYISLVLAVSNQALTHKSASPRVTTSENPRYTFHCWLIRIGLNGDEFKSCRKYLLSHLEGNIAWLHHEDAIKQRERLKAERIAAREQRVEPVREVSHEIENVPDELSEPTVSECEEVAEYEEEETFEMSMLRRSNTMSKKQLYIAYGSNINLEQMAYRCPHSKVVGVSEIKDYELEFRGVATVVPKENASVPVLIWELDERDLPILNKYEGHPHLYKQEKMSFELNGKSYEGMAYLMNHGSIAPPSPQYYNTILQGYRENGLDESYLETALENSIYHEQLMEMEDEFDELDDDLQMKF